MLKDTKELLCKYYGIGENVYELHEKALKDIEPYFKKIEDIREYNQLKVLRAMQEEYISENHFTNSAGYGYDDIGRDALDKVFARIFGGEAAIVRPHFVSGTHAICTALFGNLRPGNTMLSICGTPYDTLHSVIGIGDKTNVGSLKEYGINFKQIELKEDDSMDLELTKKTLEEDETISLVHIQRSTGYGWRNALSIDAIEAAVKVIKSVRADIKVFVDNCYGEFLDTKEPCDVGVDIIAGSLIKNAGGGIAPTGGYVIGTKECVEQAAYRLTSPGIGGECGSTLGVTRVMYQGLFYAPHISMEAVKTAIYTSRIMELAGFEVLPKFSDARNDIIQAIKFNDKEKLIEFVKAIQAGSPVDSFVSCEPWAMPGYDDEVIMAAGAFVQGSSIELSADAPIREPFIAYLQGGLTFEHGKIGVLIALSRILN